VLISAIANAQENHNLSPEGLRISAILVDEGPRLKRMQARAMGRGNRIIKKTSHITVVVEDYEVARPVKPHGTKAKSRPTFGQSGKAKKTPAAAAPVVETVVEEPVTEVIEEIVPVEEVVAEVTPVAEATETATEEPTAEAGSDATDEAPASDDQGAE